MGLFEFIDGLIADSKERELRNTTDPDKRWVLEQEISTIRYNNDYARAEKRYNEACEYRQSGEKAPRWEDYAPNPDLY